MCNFINNDKKKTKLTAFTKLHAISDIKLIYAIMDYEKLLQIVVLRVSKTLKQNVAISPSVNVFAAYTEN